MHFSETFFLILILVLASCSTSLSQKKIMERAKVPCVIDTDAGTDDFMAIAYLLTQKDLRIEAITVSNGLSHVEQGARNIERLLALAGRSDIQVFIGRSTPLSGNNSFPEYWRQLSDELQQVELPKSGNSLSSQSATDFLKERFKKIDQPLRILALGPLTNLAEAIQAMSGSADVIKEIVFMGGAFDVPGNLVTVEGFESPNDKAEWNVFVDPTAASIVFKSSIPISVIPLDATNKVPLNSSFVERVRKVSNHPLGRFTLQVVGAAKVLIDSGQYYAWDPLAAVAFIDPSVVTFDQVSVEIEERLPNQGQTRRLPDHKPNASIAKDANKLQFEEKFLAAFLK
jgi:inosine-uridine nucleoside N-ribohydrolase